MSGQHEMPGCGRDGHVCALATSDRTIPPAHDPLILKFQTGRGRYAFHANTGVILKLDQVCFELLDFIESGPRCKVPSVITERFPPEEVAASRSRLELLLNVSGVFRPVSVKSRLASPEFVANNLERIAGTFGQLILEVTQNCNLRCRYCAYSGRHAGMRAHNDLMMPWDVARKAIDFFLNNPSQQFPDPYISFYGGEPTLNMGLVRRCVEYARSRHQNVRFGITTNGTLLDEEVTRFLVAHDFSLYVSLDGPRAIHDRDRVFAGGGGTFDVVSRNLRALKEFAPEYYLQRVLFQCTLSPGEDYLALLDFFAGASDLIGGHPPLFSFETGSVSDCFSATQLAESKSELGALEEKYLQKVIRGDRGDTEFAVLRQIFEKPYLCIHRRMVRPNGQGEVFHTRGICFPGNARLFVCEDGTYLPCEKSSKALGIGSVEKGLDEANSYAIYRAYHDLHQNECRTCWAMNLCAMCFARDVRRTGTFEAGLHQPTCEGHREYWKGVLTKYVSVLEQNPEAFEHLNDVTVIQARVPFLDDLPDTCTP